MVDRIGSFVGANGSTVFIELASGNGSGGISDLPEGAEVTGVVDTIAASVEQIKSTISNVVAFASEGLKQHGPAEWTISFELGFSGSVSPIPILVRSEADAVMTITATWKRTD